MGKFSFDEDEYEEPTFSLIDFKKWLNKQGAAESDLKVERVVDSTPPPPRDKTKEKEEFKEKLRKRRNAKKKED